MNLWCFRSPGFNLPLFMVVPSPWARSVRYLRYFRSPGLDLHAIYGTSAPLGSIYTLFTVLPIPWAWSCLLRGMQLLTLFCVDAPFWGNNRGRKKARKRERKKERNKGRWQEGKRGEKNNDPIMLDQFKVCYPLPGSWIPHVNICIYIYIYIYILPYVAPKMGPKTI